MKIGDSDAMALSTSDGKDEKDPAFIERLRVLANKVGSVNALARASGLSQGGLQRYFKGGEPTRPALIKLAKAGDVDVGWLMTGEHPPQLPAASGDEEDTYAYIPLYDARISQGHGAWNEGGRVLTKLAFTRYSLRKKGLEASQLAAVRVDGDSNEPVLSDGDTVMVDLRRNELQGEAFYVIRLDDLLYAKRLQRQYDGSILVISANPAYQPMTIPYDRIDTLQIVGRIVWAGGWMV
jgi:phage repressor protein C with HTH and peptisase S24 domain